MKLILSIFAVFTFFNVYAEPLNNAELAFKIPLAKEPSTRPMTVAFIPAEKKILHCRWRPRTYWRRTLFKITDTCLF